MSTPKNPEKHSSYLPKEKKSKKPFHDTPNLDELEKGPWPSFVTGLKRLAMESDMMVDLLGQLEHSYKTRLGYWKGGTISVFGYGGGIIPRFTELKNEDGSSRFPEAQEFHTMRIQPPGGFHYTTDMLRQIMDLDEKYGDVFVDTNKSFEHFKQWNMWAKEKENHPEGLRRPLWMARPLTPQKRHFYLDK